MREHKKKTGSGGAVIVKPVPTPKNI